MFDTALSFLHSNMESKTYKSFSEIKEEN